MKNVIETTCVVLSESKELIVPQPKPQPKESSMFDSISNFFSDTFTEENINNALEITASSILNATATCVDGVEYVADTTVECASTVADATTSAYEQGKQYVSNLNTDEFKERMSSFTTESK